MVYDWEHKEAECYRLYVEERKSLDEVMDYFKQKGFAPSKRAFQTQFKRWEFPSKQNPAHKNAPLVVRIKELWERNTSQKDMLRILHAEGFDIKERELMRVRAKNRWLLRVPNGMKGAPQDSPGSNGTRTVMQELEQAILEENQEVKPPTQSAEAQRKRQERLARMQIESDERWAARKRRRRTRGWAGLPADPPGPPRFPSETTLDESKAFLSLDNTLYRQARDQFQAICEHESVLKKTDAGPEKWQKTKDRLISENPHLQHIFWNDQTHKVEQKALALDVICTDVTKRMRTLERRMTIAEAKNVIAINPEESRQVRNAFYALLVADEFTSKLETGDEHWNELKSRWIADSPILQRILAPGASDPQHQVKVRAIEVLCRDVMKRLRDDQAKKDPSRRRQFAGGPGPGPAPPRHVPQTAMDMYPHIAPTAPMVVSQMNGISGGSNDHDHTVSNQGHGHGHNHSHNHHSAAASAAAAAAVQQASELQIDPSLLLAAADPSVVNGHIDPSLANAQYINSNAGSNTIANNMNGHSHSRGPHLNHGQNHAHAHMPINAAMPPPLPSTSSPPPPTPHQQAATAFAAAHHPYQMHHHPQHAHHHHQQQHQNLHPQHPHSQIHQHHAHHHPHPHPHQLGSTPPVASNAFAPQMQPGGLSYPVEQQQHRQGMGGIHLGL